MCYNRSLDDPPGIPDFSGHQHSDTTTSTRLQKHTDILTIYKEYGMIMEEPLVNETDIS